MTDQITDPLFRRTRIERCTRSGGAGLELFIPKPAVAQLLAALEASPDEYLRNVTAEIKERIPEQWR